jgi:hypothetical protein
MFQMSWLLIILPDWLLQNSNVNAGTKTLFPKDNEKFRCRLCFMQQQHWSVKAIALANKRSMTITSHIALQMLLNACQHPQRSFAVLTRD